MRAAALLVILLAAPPCLARRKAARDGTESVVMVQPRGLPALKVEDVEARPAGMGRAAAYLALAIDTSEGRLPAEPARHG